jgi:hypothetical protein
MRSRCEGGFDAAACLPTSGIVTVSKELYRAFNCFLMLIGRRQKMEAAGGAGSG